MSRFFNLFSVVCACLLSAALGAGQFAGQLNLPGSVHLLLGLSAALTTVSLHCLIFGIFTGAGKDTRELVQDLHLDPEFVGATKRFRKIAFPPALYCIFLIVATTTAGGALSAVGGNWRWAHLILGWVTLVYNLKTFILESRCVRQNSEILARVNRLASETILSRPEEAKAIPDLAGMIPAATESLEWGAHVFAFGKFLVFLGWNVWLPYIYLRFVMDYFRMPVWPFLAAFLCLLAGGHYLKWRYQDFRPPSQSPA